MPKVAFVCKFSSRVNDGGDIGMFEIGVGRFCDFGVIGVEPYGFYHPYAQILLVIREEKAQFRRLEAEGAI